jgi:hypothetical protein
VGDWQRVPFICRVGAGERIYGVRIYVMASWVGFSSGLFTGDAVFDNLRFAFFDSSIDNTAITVGADGTLSGAGGGKVTITGLGYVGDLNATYGANASNFTGTVGGANLLRYSAFRSDANADGVPDGWYPYNNSGQPATWARSDNGVLGSGEVTITWAVNNDSTKGVYCDGTGQGVQGGWMPGATYVVSLYAKATGTNVGQGLALGWNTGPTSSAAILAPPLSASWQRYAWRITWGGSVEPGGHLFPTLNASTQGTLSFSAAQVTLGDVLTAWSEAIDDVRALANTALANITQIGSDGVLTPGEKPILIREYAVITQEKPGLVAQAGAARNSVAGQLAAYTAAYDALVAYLATLTTPYPWNSMSGTTTVVGSTLRDKFAAYYETKQALMNALVGDVRTDVTQTLNDIANIVSDGVLTPAEKSVLIQDWGTIYNEVSSLHARAVSYFSAPTLGASVQAADTAYLAAYSNLLSYLNTLTSPVAWNNLNGNTNVDGPSLRGLFTAYYTAKQALIDLIGGAAGQTAAWSGVTNVSVTTGQIAAEQATQVLQATAAGPFTEGLNGQGGRELAPVSFSLPQGHNYKVIVTCVATLTKTGTTLTGLGWVMSRSAVRMDGTGYGWITTQTPINLPFNTAYEFNTPVTLSYMFDALPAGNHVASFQTLLQDIPLIMPYDAKDVTVRVEIIKR